MDSTMEAVLEGAMAGTLATLPMSAVMIAAEKAGLMGQQPPEVITKRMLDELEVKRDESTNHAAASAMHLAFGAGAGALFNVARQRIDPSVPPVIAGIVFGLLVYGVSYSGWIPALNILPKPMHDRPGRQPSMVAAHVVYGALLGALSRQGT
jgi:hypothetical protein